jgi:hypothetical protein
LGLSRKSSEGFEELCKLERCTTEYFENERELMTAKNYIATHVIQPEFFDIDYNRNEIIKALKAPASIVLYSKTFCNEGYYDSHVNKDMVVIQQSTKYQSPTFKSRGYLLQELIRLAKDPVGEQVCRVCGSPHSISTCAKCEWASYCGSNCQRLDWNEHKKDCKLSTKGRRPEPVPPSVRFKIGDIVECYMDPPSWYRGTIVALHYREDEWSSSRHTAPYQVELLGHPANRNLIYAPYDDVSCVRLAKKTIPTALSSKRVEQFGL